MESFLMLGYCKGGEKHREQRTVGDYKSKGAVQLCDDGDGQIAEAVSVYAGVKAAELRAGCGRVSDSRERGFVAAGDVAAARERLAQQRNAMTNLKLLGYMSELAMKQQCILPKQYEQITKLTVGTVRAVIQKVQR